MLPDTHVSIHVSFFFIFLYHFLYAFLIHDIYKYVFIFVCSCVRFRLLFCLLVDDFFFHFIIIFFFFHSLWSLLRLLLHLIYAFMFYSQYLKELQRTMDKLYRNLNAKGILH